MCGGVGRNICYAEAQVSASSNDREEGRKEGGDR